VAQRRFELAHLSLDELAALWEDIDTILRSKATELDYELARLKDEDPGPWPKRKRRS
jgi:hypothetical protein